MASGELRWLHTRAQCFRDVHGRITGVQDRVSRLEGGQERK